MASLRIATFMQGIELWESDVDPNAVVLPIGLGSMCVQNSAGTVRFWLCTALPSTWVNVSAGGSGVPLSSLLAATAVNTIDSLALAQTWNWSTATTQAALSLAAAALTSGGLLALTNTSAAHTGRVLALSSNTTAAIANGALRVQATGAHTGNLVQLDDVTAAGTLLAATGTALTSGTIVDLVNSSATHTGRVLGLTTNSTAAISNGALRVQSTGAHTGNLVQIDDVTATGTIVAVNATAITGGTMVDLANSNATHTGRVLAVSTSTTAAIQNGALRVNGAGAHTGNLVQFESITATGNVLSAQASALTTGTIVDIVNSSAAINSTLGLLRVINNTATTAGFLARFQSNTGANSGLSILCSGNVGVGIAAPVATFHNAGATVLGNTALGNFAGGGSIGTPLATVDAFSSATIAQTTAAQTLSIDAPSNTTAGRIFRVANVGSQSFTLLGLVITTAATPATAALTAFWNGSAWVAS